ncbi:MAG: CDP-diacylglycerol--glycerol-3-phosphate 3-phosphatidyltransferase [Deltaproteobacteria bacterium]|nr:CDP-diacylglycerol--glycerol-3-phosphate 3-phosphatidyltransferase [Deltaproteobacteria bacterium]
MILNVPNTLTLFRIFLVPVFIYLTVKDRLHAATVVFIVAGVTDAIDGFIARTFKQRTEFGANIDPLADKLLLSGAFIVLTIKGFVPLWLCVPVIIRDIVILAGVIMLRSSGRKVVIAPSVFGKLTTLLQITTVVYAMAFSGKTGDIPFLSIAAVTALVTVYTGFDYARREFRIQFRQGSRR